MIKKSLLGKSVYISETSTGNSPSLIVREEEQFKKNAFKKFQNTEKHFKLKSLKVVFLLMFFCFSQNTDLQWF